MRTLYEDWQLRRDRLAKHAPLAHVADQARVLDFLLSRYAGDARSQEPARFPLQTELFFDSRAIIVHHHLGRGAYNGTRSPAEAHKRARKLLEHIAEVNPQDSIGPPGSEIDLLNHGDAPAFSLRRKVGGLIESAVLGTDSEDANIERCQRLLTQDATLPEWAVTYLTRVALISDPRNPAAESAHPKALQVLRDCDNDSAVQFFVDQWIGDERNVRFQQHAFAYLNRMKARAGDRVRAHLGDSYWPARARAAILLGFIGSLDDIGLLQDLLSLPEMKNETPERTEYLMAMKQLSGMIAARVESAV